MRWRRASAAGSRGNERGGVGDVGGAGGVGGAGERLFRASGGWRGPFLGWRGAHAPRRGPSRRASAANSSGRSALRGPRRSTPRAGAPGMAQAVVEARKQTLLLEQGIVRVRLGSAVQGSQIRSRNRPSRHPRRSQKARLRRRTGPRRKKTRPGRGPHPDSRPASDDRGPGGTLGFGGTHERSHLRAGTLLVASSPSRGGGFQVRVRRQAAPMLPGAVPFEARHRRARRLLQPLADGAQGERSGRLRSAPSEPLHSRDLPFHVRRDHGRHPDQAVASQIHGRRPQAALQVRGSRQENDGVEERFARKQKDRQMERRRYFSMVKEDSRGDVRRFPRSTRTFESTILSHISIVAIFPMTLFDSFLFFSAPMPTSFDGNGEEVSRRHLFKNIPSVRGIFEENQREALQYFAERTRNLRNQRSVSTDRVSESVVLSGPICHSLSSAAARRSLHRQRPGVPPLSKRHSRNQHYVFTKIGELF